MAIGRYPIPPPEEEELINALNSDPENSVQHIPPRLPPGARPPSELIGGNCEAPRPMAIFELLDYIVNQVGCLLGLKYLKFFNDYIRLAIY